MKELLDEQLASLRNPELQLLLANNFTVPPPTSLKMMGGVASHSATSPRRAHQSPASPTVGFPPARSPPSIGPSLSSPPPGSLPSYPLPNPLSPRSGPPHASSVASLSAMKQQKQSLSPTRGGRSSPPLLELSDSSPAVGSPPSSPSRPSPAPLSSLMPPGGPSLLSGASRSPVKKPLDRQVEEWLAGALSNAGKEVVVPEALALAYRDAKGSGRVAGPEPGGRAEAPPPQPRDQDASAAAAAGRLPRGGAAARERPPSLRPYLLDRESLSAIGVPAELISRVHRALYVYSIGFHNLVEDVRLSFPNLPPATDEGAANTHQSLETPNPTIANNATPSTSAPAASGVPPLGSSLPTLLWQAFTSLLSRVDPAASASTLSSVCRAHAFDASEMQRHFDEREEEMKSASESREKEGKEERTRLEEEVEERGKKSEKQDALVKELEECITTLNEEAEKSKAKMEEDAEAIADYEETQNELYEQVADLKEQLRQERDSVKRMLAERSANPVGGTGGNGSATTPKNAELLPQEDSSRRRRSSLLSLASSARRKSGVGVNAIGAAQVAARETQQDETGSSTSESLQQHQSHQPRPTLLSSASPSHHGQGAARQSSAGAVHSPERSSLVNFGRPPSLDTSLGGLSPHHLAPGAGDHSPTHGTGSSTPRGLPSVGRPSLLSAGMAASSRTFTGQGSSHLVNAINSREQRASMLMTQLRAAGTDNSIVRRLSSKFTSSRNLSINQGTIAGGDHHNASPYSRAPLQHSGHSRTQSLDETLLGISEENLHGGIGGVEGHHRHSELYHPRSGGGDDLHHAQEGNHDSTNSTHDAGSSMSRGARSSVMVVPDKDRGGSSDAAAQLSALRVAYDTLSQEIQRERTHREDVERKLHEEVGVLIDATDDLNKRKTELEAHVEDQDKHAASLIEEVDDLNQQLEVMESSKNDIIRQYNNQLNEMKTMQGIMDREKETKHALLGKVRGLEIELFDSGKLVKSLNADIIKLKQNIEDQKVVNSHVRDKLGEMSHAYHAEKEAHDDLQDKYNVETNNYKNRIALLSSYAKKQELAHAAWQFQASILAPNADKFAWKLAEAEREISVLDDHVVGLERGLKTTEVKLKREQIAHESDLTDYRHEMKAHEHSRAEIKDLQRNVEDLKGAKKLLETDLSKMTRKYDDKKAQFDSLAQEIEMNSAMISEMTTELEKNANQRVSQVGAKDIEIAKLRHSLTERKEELDKTLDELQQLRIENVELQRQVEHSESAVATGVVDRSQMLGALKKLAKEGRESVNLLDALLNGKLVPEEEVRRRHPKRKQSIFEGDIGAPPPPFDLQAGSERLRLEFEDFVELERVEKSTRNLRVSDEIGGVMEECVVLSQIVRRVKASHTSVAKLANENMQNSMKLQICKKEFIEAEEHWRSVNINLSKTAREESAELKRELASKKGLLITARKMAENSSEKLKQSSKDLKIVKEKYKKSKDALEKCDDLMMMVHEDARGEAMRFCELRRTQMVAAAAQRVMHSVFTSIWNRIVPAVGGGEEEGLRDQDSDMGPISPPLDLVSSSGEGSGASEVDTTVVELTRRPFEKNESFSPNARGHHIATTIGGISSSILHRRIAQQTHLYMSGAMVSVNNLWLSPSQLQLETVLNGVGRFEHVLRHVEHVAARTTSQLQLLRREHEHMSCRMKILSEWSEKETTRKLGLKTFGAQFNSNLREPRPNGMQTDVTWLARVPQMHSDNPDQRYVLVGNVSWDQRHRRGGGGEQYFGGGGEHHDDGRGLAQGNNIRDSGASVRESSKTPPSIFRNRAITTHLPMQNPSDTGGGGEGIPQFLRPHPPAQSRSTHVGALQYGDYGRAAGAGIGSIQENMIEAAGSPLQEGRSMAQAVGGPGLASGYGASNPFDLSWGGETSPPKGAPRRITSTAGAQQLNLHIPAALPSAMVVQVNSPLSNFGVGGGAGGYGKLASYRGGGESLVGGGDLAAQKRESSSLRRGPQKS